MSGRSLGVVAAFAAALTLGAMTTVPASAEPAGNPIVEVKSVAFDQCMTGGTADPFVIELAACTGAATQRWEKVGRPNGQFFLRNVADRWCLDGYYSLLTEQCDDTRAYQRWELVPDSSGATKLKMGVSWPAYADTIYYEWGGGISPGGAGEDVDHQRWVVTEVGRTTPSPDTGGALVTLENSRWWGVQKTDNCAGGAGMDVCPGSPFQRVELGGGVIQLEVGEHCLRPKPGTTAVQYVDLAGDCATTDPEQRWQMEGPDAFGGYLLRNVAKGNYLSPSSPSMHLYGRDLRSTQFQRWYFHLA